MTWNNEDKVPSGISQQLQNTTNRLSPILEKKKGREEGQRREGGKKRKWVKERRKEGREEKIKGKKWGIQKHK